MSGTGSIVEPQEKMRSRDVNKVARGEQAPRPPQQTPNVSKPPPPSSTSTKVEGSKGNKHDDEWLNEAKDVDDDTSFSSVAVDKPRYCYTRYLEYHICTKDGGKDCEKFKNYYRSQCPSEWIEKWNKQRESGKFPSPV